ncbi:hypothetical protein NQ036_03670 [Brevibacterium sp. 91QC2O2]|uniref:hypothetical protein n=1 Tax=Brevibacterium TaxID=1696 RepID=UPI00211C7C14|nr:MULTISPECIES: hypothetical protein [unclassified Brevibacterium]MCQ9367345.1 hypothetical protein [Brevibacterium sp. 91QC2O2]MCQ9384642.1 hypothetical protein [Brevibacterium sp. 68QC2CO]
MGDTTASTTDPKTPPPAPAGDQTDWEAKYHAAVAESRKWETRAKSNRDERDAAQTRATELEQANQGLTDKVAGFETAKARTDLVAKIAGEKNVDATVLALMAGDTEDALTKAAETLQGAAPSAPVVPSAGDNPPAPPVSEEMQAVRSLFSND